MARLSVGLLALALSGCAAGAPEVPASPALPAAHAPQPAPQPASPALPASQPPLPAAPVRAGPVRLVAELARTPEQRAAGLRGRQVPLGTGMAFLYPGGADVAFTMAGVDRPLVAVFAARGRVVEVATMPPCAGTVARCPTYGRAAPVDLVVEAAPATLAGVAAGDPVQVG